MVEFDKALKAQKEELKAKGFTDEQLEKETPLLLEAQEMLLKWEQGDEEVVNLWKLMNTWVYAGFGETYEKMGVNFDKYYYESDTYLLGKEVVDVILDEVKKSGTIGQKVGEVADVANPKLRKSDAAAASSFVSVLKVLPE